MQQVLPVQKDPVEPSEWSIEQTIQGISSLDPSLATHVEAFRSHEIDGKALLLLTSDMMMKYLGLKLGPALKISNIINKFKGKKHLPIGWIQALHPTVWDSLSILLIVTTDWKALTQANIYQHNTAGLKLS